MSSVYKVRVRFRTKRNSVAQLKRRCLFRKKTCIAIRTNHRYAFEFPLDRARNVRRVVDNNDIGPLRDAMTDEISQPHFSVSSGVLWLTDDVNPLPRCSLACTPAPSGARQQFDIDSSRGSTASKSLRVRCSPDQAEMPESITGRVHLRATCLRLQGLKRTRPA